MAVKIQLPSIAALPADASARIRILTAGVEVLHTAGFAALTQQAVAEKAGVRQSHITYYFPTRIDLLQATAQYGAEYMLSSISNAATAGELTYANFCDLLLPDEADRNWWRLMTSLVDACSESENIRSWVLKFDDQIRTRLRQGFGAFGVALTEMDSKFIHASYVGALTMDVQEMTAASQRLARDIVRRAIDFVVKESGVKPAFAMNKAHAEALMTRLTPPQEPEATQKKSRAASSKKEKKTL